MDKTTHEIIKMHLKESNGASFVSLAAPEFWIQAKPEFWIEAKPAFWISE